jgi:hypothetical protein
MSGFERANGGGAWTNDETCRFPEDFSTDEAEFACELHTLFAPEQEELPPLYTETLLSNPHAAPAEPGYEHKLTYRVLRQLRLARAPLYVRSTLWRAALHDMLRQVSRPVAASTAAAVLLMTLTAIIATPSFASGLSLLLGHSGVRQVQSYPNNVRAPTHPSGVSKLAPLELSPGMSMYWLGPQAGNYVYASTRLLDPTEWSNGAMLDVQYIQPGQTAGSGLLDIREFQVSDKYAAVLQVVQAGSASLVKAGNDPAVYVDGTWVPRGGHDMWPADENPPPFIWQSGIRSELIIEHAGVVFWIVGDLRDGAGQAALVQFARQLQPADKHLLQPRHVGGDLLGEADQTFDASFRTPAGKEVYQEVPAGMPVDSGAGAFVAAPS